MVLGKKGETIACFHLRKKGFKILKQNYRCRLGEIDIVAKRKNLLVFCEVKTRLNQHFGKPFESVNENKQRRIKKLAEYYLAQYKPKYDSLRFDVISILAKENKTEVDHIENAF